MKEFITPSIKNTVLIKIGMYLVGLLGTLPILSMTYWVLDSAYLSEFGIGPELYSRPIFSSSFITAWLSAIAIKPISVGLLVVSFLLFLLVFSANFNRKKARKAPPTNTQENKDALFPRFSEAFEKAFISAAILLLAGFTVLLCFAILITTLSNEGKKLAAEQIDTYVTNGTCIDAFNNIQTGCYVIEGEGGKDHLVIHNGDKFIIFMSRYPKTLSVRGEGAVDVEFDFTITVKNKHYNKKVTRQFTRVNEDLTTNAG